MRGSFLDDDASLLRPTPSSTGFDPDDVDGLDDSTVPSSRSARKRSQAEVDIDVAIDKPGRKRNRSLLLRGKVDLDETKYGGKPVSRKEATTELQDDEEIDNDGADDDDADDDDDVDSGDALQKDEDGLDSEENASSFDDGEDLLGRVEDGEDVDAEETGVNPVDAAKIYQTQLDELREAEMKELMRLEGEKKKEMKRVKAVKEQKALYDSLLTVRIRLQKVLELANRMPTKEEEEEEGIDNLRTRYASGTESASLALRKLSSGLFNLCGLLREECGGHGKTKKKMKENLGVAEQWKRWMAMKKEQEGWRNEMLEVWGDKATAASGKLQRGGGSKFKALNQSAVTQINSVLSDRDRLVKRTRLKRKPVERFGGGQEGKVFSSNSTTEYEEEIYDDGDFYQQLVREVIEQGSTAAQQAEVRKSRQKSRKIIDRRASKGRKIRYQVHEKLVGFVAPTPFDPPAALNELVSGLFQS